MRPAHHDGHWPIGAATDTPGRMLGPANRPNTVARPWHKKRNPTTIRNAERRAPPTRSRESSVTFLVPFQIGASEWRDRPPFGRVPLSDTRIALDSHSGLSGGGGCAPAGGRGGRRLRGGAAASTWRPLRVLLSFDSDSHKRVTAA